MNALPTLQIAIGGFLIGANAWFFFLQSPALIASMGREKFVPLQMRLTKLLFRSLAIAGGAFLLLSLLSQDTLAIPGAALAAVAATGAHFLVIPRALRAGGKGRAETAAAGGDASVARFASEGSGPSAAFWHRTVVVFVVLILAGAVWSINGTLR